MQTEKDCKPSEKNLQAIIAFSDKAVKIIKDEIIERCKDKEKGIAYEKFLNWTRQENEIAVFTSYAYADFSIPKKFDCIFSYDNPEVYIHIKFILTQSIFEGWYPSDFIDHGHKHLCILTFDNQIPDIFGKLHLENKNYLGLTWDIEKVLGLCQMADIQSIIDRQHKQTKLKKLHGDNWYHFDDHV